MASEISMSKSVCAHDSWRGRGRVFEALSLVEACTYFVVDLNYFKN